MNTDRRNFLRSIGNGIVMVSGYSFLSSCNGIQRTSLPCDKNRSMELTGLEEDHTEILRLASLAPSGHNTQPWFVRIDNPQQWTVGSVSERWLPAVDPDNRELLLSIGAFIENLSIGAGIHGYRLQIRYIARNGNNRELLRIRLIRSRPVSFPVEKIRLRRTVRKGLLTNNISREDLTYITQGSAGSFSYFPRGSTEAAFLEEGTIESNRIQAYRNEAQAELASWIRWSDSDAAQHMNGITPESMEIEGFSGWFVRHFYDRESVLDNSFRERTVEMVREQAVNCGGWLTITSNGSSVRELIETGRKFQRMFLKVREKMIAIHPMTQILEESPWKQRAARELGINNQIQFILRIGYLRNYPDPVSLRMPVSRFAQQA